MGLGLKTDFDDFHRTDDSDGFGCSGSETGEEDSRGGGGVGDGVGEPSFVGFEGSEADRHFWDDSGEDGTEAFVEGERCFSLDYMRTGCYEPAGFGLFERKREEVRGKGEKEVRRLIREGLDDWKERGGRTYTGSKT